MVTPGSRRCVQGSGLPRQGSASRGRSPWPGGVPVQGAITLGRSRGPIPEVRYTSAEAEYMGVDVVPEVGDPGLPWPPAAPRGVGRAPDLPGEERSAPDSPLQWAHLIALATGLGPALPGHVNRKWACARRALPAQRRAGAIVNGGGQDQSRKTSGDDPIARAGEGGRGGA